MRMILALVVTASLFFTIIGTALVLNAGVERGYVMLHNAIEEATK